VRLVPFPSPPWQMSAQMWLSVFVLRESTRPDRTAGLYGAAFVDYQQGSPLTYHELLVARLCNGLRRQVRITDIWVDSEESKNGGRSLWAIPKQIAELPLEEQRSGPVTRTRFAGYAGGERIATGRFTATPGAALVRAPFAASTSQLREGGSTVVTSMRGSAKSLPCLGSWDFDAQGPLGFLHGRRPLASFRLADVRLTFG
jgi:hypothetical protein